jgi:hypothetical protein
MKRGNTMDGLYIKVKTVDGVEGTYPLRPKTIVGFEQKFNKGFAKLLTEDQKLEHVYFLAHGALRDAGIVVKPFGEAFLDTLESVELASDPNSESTEIA